MGIIERQIIIFFTIVISSVIGGKKGSLIASGVWLIQTLIMLNSNFSNYIQLIVVALSFQLGMIIGIIKDLIIKKLKNLKKSRVDVDSK